ncbi:hypothetical protein GGX14DRAFT_405819 [Mycena pura]|uniref:Uncharacterized protein n=1 Tax=Mycena pura TaxID=153505 RepID=A0AAD6UT47_9AGAR|nr:hypothetical protein GGX14DRAFT_405819 [Mycena pura]
MKYELGFISMTWLSVTFTHGARRLLALALAAVPAQVRAPRNVDASLVLAPAIRPAAAPGVRAHALRTAREPAVDIICAHTNRGRNSGCCMIIYDCLNYGPKLP